MKHLEPFFEYSKPTRSVELSKEEFISTLKSNCKDWLKNPHLLVRRKESEMYKYSVLNPKKHKRRSVSESNHVTMLMDNLPSWSKFPKRSNSVIFSVNVQEDYATAFGNEIFFVIPFDNAIFGVAPEIDLWSVMVKEINGEPISTRYLAMNEDLSNAFNRNGAPKNYRGFSKSMELLFNNPDASAYVEGFYAKKLLAYYEESGKNKFMDFLNETLAPENFHDRDRNQVNDDGYTVKNYKETINYLTRRGSECWTESECLIYYAGTSSLSLHNVNVLYERFIQELGI